MRAPHTVLCCSLDEGFRWNKSFRCVCNVFHMNRYSLCGDCAMATATMTTVYSMLVWCILLLLVGYTVKLIYCGDGDEDLEFLNTFFFN